MNAILGEVLKSWIERARQKKKQGKGTPRWPTAWQSSITASLDVGANQTGFRNPPFFKGMQVPVRS